MKERLALKDKKVTVIDDTPTEDELLDRALRKITGDSKIRSPKSWIERLNKRETKQDILQRLVQKGILFEKEEKVLWVFTRHKYPTEQEAPEQQVRRRILECLDQNRTPDQKTAILLSLLKACDLIREIVPRERKKEVEKQIEALTKDNSYGKAVKATVDAMQAAIIACVAASAAASAANSASAGGGS